MAIQTQSASHAHEKILEAVASTLHAGRGRSREAIPLESGAGLARYFTRAMRSAWDATTLPSLTSIR